MIVVITDVTYMRHGRICIAGWCPDENRMVRPLLESAQPWTIDHLSGGTLTVGHVVAFQPSRQAAGSIPPHATEDLVVTGMPRLLKRVDLPQFLSMITPSVSPDVESIFGGHLQRRRLVRQGAPCRSLGAITVRARAIGFEAREREGRRPQLRCWFYDGSNIRYNFPVVGTG